MTEELERALHAVAERAAMGVRTWQRLLEFVDLRATAEEEYALALSRAQGVWSTQKRRAFFSRDAGKAASPCLASAGQVGSLRDGLAAVVDIESERIRQLAADRAAALRELCRGADTTVDGADAAVQGLRERADLLLGELKELVSELTDSREMYDRRSAERQIVEAQIAMEMGDGGRSNAQEKLARRLEAADVALQGAQAPYSQLLEIVNQLLATLQSVEMPELLKEFEELERRKPSCKPRGLLVSSADVMRGGYACTGRMNEMGTLLRAFVRLHRRGAAFISESQWCMEEAVGSVLRLSRVAPDADHTGTRGDVKELWIQSDLQMLYGDALAFFAGPPRQLLAHGIAEQTDLVEFETSSVGGATITEAENSGSTPSVAKAVASAVRAFSRGTATDIPGGGVSEAWLEVMHVLCEGVRRVTATTAQQLSVGARPALLCKVDHEDAVRCCLRVLHCARLRSKVL